MPHPNDSRAITATVTRFVQAVDAGDWEMFRAVLTDQSDSSHGA